MFWRVVDDLDGDDVCEVADGDEFRFGMYVSERETVESTN
jgi:myo-inositol-hexaphosphate 3-phosphohydrolase